MSGRVLGSPLDGTTGHGRDTEPGPVEDNRHAFLRAGGFDPLSLTIALQTHSTNVAVATVEHRGRGLFPAFDGFPTTDGMVTSESSVVLGTIVADCTPLVLYDRRV